jgi:hypothetical protein
MGELFLRKLLDLILLGIRRNHFEIAALAEREQCVARTTAGMHTAKGGADAGTLLDEVDTAIEVVTAEKNVIEQ